MAKPPRPWTVTQHDPIRKLEKNLWDVEGSLPGAPMKRRMTIARRQDGRLVLFNGVPLEESAMKELEAWGEPAFLVVPNGGHRLDIHAYKQRYPKLRVLCPARAAKKVSERVPVDGSMSDFPADPDIALEELGGSKYGDGMMVVKSRGSTTIVFADAFFNIPKAGLLLTLLGFTGGPKLTRVFRMFFLADAAGYAAHMRRLAELPGLKRLIVTHGDIVESDAPGVLRRLADSA